MNRIGEDVLRVQLISCRWQKLKVTRGLSLTYFLTLKSLNWKRKRSDFREIFMTKSPIASDNFHFLPEIKQKNSIILQAISFVVVAVVDFFFLHHNITHEKNYFLDNSEPVCWFFLRFCFVWNSCTVHVSIMFLYAKQQHTTQRSSKKFHSECAEICYIFGGREKESLYSVVELEEP